MYLVDAEQTWVVNMDSVFQVRELKNRVPF